MHSQVSPYCKVFPLFPVQQVQVSHPEREGFHADHDGLQVTQEVMFLHTAAVTPRSVMNSVCSCGRCGPLIDLCRGPHVRHTGKIKALKIYKVNRIWCDLKQLSFCQHWFIWNTDDPQLQFCKSFIQSSEMLSKWTERKWIEWSWTE